MGKAYDEQDWAKSLLRLTAIFLAFVGLVSGAIIYYFYYA